jgi:hypothetical protein
MTADYGSVDSVLLKIDFDGLARFSRNALDFRIESEFDALAFKQGSKTFGDIVFFSIPQAFVPFEHGHFASEAAQGLRRFQSDKTGTDHNEMIRDLVAVREEKITADRLDSFSDGVFAA